MILTVHPLLLDAASTPLSSAVRYGVGSPKSSVLPCRAGSALACPCPSDFNTSHLDVTKGKWIGTKRFGGGGFPLMVQSGRDLEVRSKREVCLFRLAAGLLQLPQIFVTGDPDGNWT
jgi:hypothetical protein